MSVDKRVMYEMQGGKKPARNYLGKQKTVSDVPVKWKSGPDAPETELAYITKPEKDMIMKANIHDSLTNGPNTGPDGIMSLDSQGDYTRDRSPSRAEGSQAPGIGGGNSDYMNQQIQAAHDQKMKDFYTGNLSKNDPMMHSTTAPGKLTRKYSDLPEWMEVKQPDGTYKTKHMASAYKSYGTPSFFGNLFSRGAPGYRGIKGLPAWGNPMKNYQLRGNKDGQMGYYTDKMNFGETRPALPGAGILGILQHLANKFKKPPPDMSEFNKLSLTNPADQKDYIPEGMDVPMARMDPWSTPKENKFDYKYDINDIASLINNAGQSQNDIFGFKNLDDQVVYSDYQDIGETSDSYNYPDRKQLVNSGTITPLEDDFPSEGIMGLDEVPTDLEIFNKRFP